MGPDAPIAIYASHVRVFEKNREKSTRIRSADSCISLRPRFDRRPHRPRWREPDEHSVESRARMSSLDLSVIVPLYNEEESIEPLFKAVFEAVEPIGLSFEVVFVDDGSQD